MTQEEINLVKSTWKMIRQIDASVVGDTFYSKLFYENPSLRQLFPAQLDEQYKKLVMMLNFLIERLDKLDTIDTEIEELANRHIRYKVRPGHYRMVGNALLWTLQQGLGQDWSEEVGNAWRKCYGTLMERMLAVKES